MFLVILFECMLVTVRQSVGQQNHDAEFQSAANNLN